MEPYLLINSDGSNGEVTVSADSSDSKEKWREYLRERFLGKKCPTTSVHADAFEYKMNHPKRGKAIILNHKTFAQPKEILRPRHGTDVDRDLMNDTFQSLGFEVVVHNDLTSKQIFSVLKSVSEEDHTNHDCLAVAVLSHGTPDSIHAFEETYKAEKLWESFTADNCGTLAGKPKLFFVVACRGDLFDDGTKLKFKPRRFVTDGGSSNDTEFYKIPNQADFLTVFSTYPGYYSWRNTASGSFFVRILCNVMKEYSGDLDVLSMMTFVNRKVATQYESNAPDDLTFHNKKQMPQVCHTLLRQMYFFKHRKQISEGINGTLV